MKKYVVIASLIALCSCATPKQQTAELQGVTSEVNGECLDLPKEVEKVICERDLVLTRAAALNYPYAAELSNVFDEQLTLAERRDARKISAKKYEAERAAISKRNGQIIRDRINADEQAAAVNSARWLAAGSILSNAGANLSAASAPSRLPYGAYELNRPLSCTSYQAGVYTNMNCY